MKNEDFDFDQDLYPTAYYVAKRAFANAGVPENVRPQYWDDIKQAAVEGFLRARGDTYTRSAVWQRGYWSALDFIFQFIFQVPSHRPGEGQRIKPVQFPPDVFLAESPEGVLLKEERRAEQAEVLDLLGDILYHIFVDSRVRGGRRTEKAAERDTQVILLSLRGYNTAGIAHELGFKSRSDAASYLSAARKRLAAWMTNEVNHDGNEDV